MWGDTKIFFTSKNIIPLLLFLIIFIPNYILSQELVWHSLNGPMGGIVGGMDINSNSEIFAGVYPFTINYTGLYKSSDNGNSWNKIETQFGDFNVYTVYITREDHIWVGTENQGLLYRSTDDGNTWENKANGFQSPECWAIGESNDGVLFAGNADGGKLYRSTNDGDSWVFSSDIGPLAFAADTNNKVFAGTFTGLHFTTDNGLTWTPVNFFTNVSVSSIVVDSSNNIYCGTGYYDNGNGVYFSEDEGQSWSQIGLAGKVVLSLAFDSERNLYAGTLKDGLFKTTDLGQNWYQYQKGIYKKEVYRLKVNKQDDIFIGSEGGGNGWYFYGGGGVFRSTNGGDSFEQVGLPISYVKNMVFSGDSLIITSTPSGVQKYNRFTRKWKNLGLHNIEAISITPSNYIYAATREEGLYKSIDLGVTWTLTNLTIDTLMAVYNVLAVNDDTLFCSTQFESDLRRSTNGGQSWNILPIHTGETYRGLYLQDKDLYASGFGSATSILYRTTNNGESFDSLYAGFDSYDFNNCISVTSNEYIFLANRDNNLSGIIRSNDDGLNWEYLLPNIRTASVFSNSLGLVITGTLVANSSDTNKIFVSTDFGNDWFSIAQPTKHGIYTTDIKQDVMNNFFFATSGVGLFNVDILVDVEEETNTVHNFGLFQNYPNPFNPITSIQYEVRSRQFITLKVYDILGNQIATLVKEEKPQGVYEVEFDGNGLSSGIYFYQLKTEEFIQTKKMILLK